jgi:hypothetical protein
MTDNTSKQVSKDPQPCLEARRLKRLRLASARPRLGTPYRKSNKLGLENQLMARPNRPKNRKEYLLT